MGSAPFAYDAIALHQNGAYRNYGARIAPYRCPLLGRDRAYSGLVVAKCLIIQEY